jgi:outer membrane protein assembly factor BamB
LVLLGGCALVWLPLSTGLDIQALGQTSVEIPPELLKPRIARVRGESLRRLERLDWLANQQAWPELFAAADELLAESRDGWIQSAPHRYIGLNEAVHRRLAALPPGGLAAYRNRVDPLADDWLRRGVESRNEVLLQRVVDQAYCSAAGDDALWALGDIHLERGDYQAARTAWQQLHAETAGDHALTYPDATIPLAQVHARLALVSIREGDLKRAKREIADFAAEHPDATGRLGGRDVNLVTRLRELLEQARQWRPIDPLQGHRPAHFEQAWSVEITPPAVETNPLAPPLVYPVIANGSAVFQDAAGVHTAPLASPADVAKAQTLFAAPASTAASTFTLTANAETAFAVVPTKSARNDNPFARQLIGLDLSREGALLLQRAAESKDTALVGPPIAAGSLVAIGELTPEQHTKATIACYDMWTGKLAWRRSLGFAVDPTLGSSAASLGMAMSRDAGTLYVNTNLGTIAAFRFANGQPQWLHTYERSAPTADTGAMNAAAPPPSPCFASRSRIVVAPDDSAHILALDAATGAKLWSTPRPEPTARILAVDGDRVLLSGDRLWAINAATGALDQHWGEQTTGGAGQSALAGGLILWPTTGDILLVDRATGKPTGRTLPLPTAGGANLVVGRAAATVAGATDAPKQSQPSTYVIAAGPTKLTAYRASTAMRTTQATPTKAD